MLSKKSKIEQLPKSRERQCLPAAASASLCQLRTKLCGRLLVIQGGPSHRRARHAPAALKNLVHLSEKPFSTASVKSSYGGPFDCVSAVPQLADDFDAPRKSAALGPSGLMRCNKTASSRLVTSGASSSAR